VHSVFVHDFVTIPLPVDRALVGLCDVLEYEASSLVRSAWEADAEIWSAAGLASEELTPGHVIDIELRGPVHRESGAVMHLRWTASGAGS